MYFVWVTPKSTVVNVLIFYVKVWGDHWDDILYVKDFTEETIWENISRNQDELEDW